MSRELNGWADDPDGLAFGENGFITPSVFNSLRDHVDGKLRFPRRVDSDKVTDDGRGYGYVPTDIVDGPKNYTFFIDVPGLSKTDVQVALEEEKILVVKGGGGGGKGKRKREEVIHRRRPVSTSTSAWSAGCPKTGASCAGSASLTMPTRPPSAPSVRTASSPWWSRRSSRRGSTRPSWCPSPD